MRALRLLPALSIIVLLAGETPAPAQSSQMTYADLFQLKGKVIAKGTNTNPVGPYGLKTYRIEELTLPSGTTVDVDGQTIRANTAWRVIVVGTSFQPRDLPPIVSIDTTNLRAGQENTDLTEIAAITFDKSLIHDGATIALSYGAERTQLPERVKLNAAR